MTETAVVFERDRYVILASLLQEPSVTQAYRYACGMADTGKMRLDDEQTRSTPSAYGDFMMEGLLEKLLPDVERAVGTTLFPTYSYFRVYKNGDILAKHTDRPSCEISVSLCLGFEGGKSWPLCIEGPHGISKADLRPGDALIYRGMECPHWREKFEGVRQVQVFLHYVDQNGPCAEWKFDKRTLNDRLRPVNTG